MHDGQKVHETVVVAGVGVTIGSIVVVLAPVDAREVRVREKLMTNSPTSSTALRPLLVPATSSELRLA